MLCVGWELGRRERGEREGEREGGERGGRERGEGGGEREGGERGGGGGGGAEGKRKGKEKETQGEGGARGQGMRRVKPDHCGHAVMTKARHEERERSSAAEMRCVRNDREAPPTIPESQTHF